MEKKETTICEIEFEKWWENINKKGLSVFELPHKALAFGIWRTAWDTCGSSVLKSITERFPILKG